MKSLLWRAALVGLVALAACSRRSGDAAGGRVAVVDLDRIAGDMGWLDEIQKELETADTELKARLNKVVTGATESIEAARKLVTAEAKLSAEQVKLLNSARDERDLEGLPLNQTQREKLTSTVAQANRALQQAMTEYQQAMQNRRAGLIMGCRERILPAARKVADARGVSIVLTTTDTVLCFEAEKADLTAAILEELRRSAPPAGRAPSASAPRSAPVPKNPAATGRLP